MPNTFTLIASSTVGAGGASSIDFTSIPSTYTDLCLKFSLRNTNNSSPVYYNWLGMRFNSSTATYTGRILLGSGTSVNSYSFSDTQFRQFAFDNQATATASTFSNGEIYVPNYAGTSANKSISVDSVAESNNASGNALGLFAGLWPSTSAITSISLYDLDAYNFVQYSTAYLYGIKNS